MAPKRGVEHGSISLEVLAAVMGWYVANAWIIEHLKSAFITSHSLATVPFPTVLSDQECIDLTRAVRAFEAAAAADRPEPAEARAEVDRILRRAYHLDDWTYERLKTIYHWATEDVFTLDSPPDTGIATHPIGGIVHGVDLEAGTIALWLDGFDSPRTVPITAVMPGWLLRPDIAFRTHLPRSCIWERNLDGAVWGRFTPQAYMYLTEAELVDGIGEILQSDGGTP